ncbi:Glycosyltransferase involved in cell wall bisynthesis [Clostridium cavendishii DSM 21758]|uniref:Glycosyltransferase involved in cell wall bisynthesis n=1 Tax=Clostridium cavendishii DSM 21758 TaxID=1121302 RepID=A0A1M6Q6X1_9CLOT|nr:glycosyltransferase family 4 protein [Clostridium cavendishii]SHK15866.1 Glycosyltransferase involved in cell wall bisynthesis [Clostridium cavendishii DSM 21758]
MNLIYVTAQVPYGKGEQFIPPEIIEMRKLGNNIKILPLRPAKEIGQGHENSVISEYCDRTPLINIKVILCLFKYIIIHPIKVLNIISKIIFKSGSIVKVFKNIILIPKGLYMGQEALKYKADHIHCHWASTSATAAYIASVISDIPWSFTAHRWDIYENNMLKEKAKTASFFRVINKKGYNDICKYIRSEDVSKCKIIHVGIFLDNQNNSTFEVNNREEFLIVVPASLIEVKGHKYLIEAINMLKDKNLICHFYGEGELEEELLTEIKKLGLQDKILLKGQVAHEDLLEMYKTKAVDVLILPSILTDAGEHEGIPVSLMEAMANKIPVISTNTGGIPELLEEGSGILVDDKSSEQLKDAILRLLEDKEIAIELGEAGYNKVLNEFDINKVCLNLQQEFKNRA